MKFSHVAITLFALTIPATYWYTTTAYQCPVPLSYRLGDIDDSFSITEAEALASIEAATQMWESAVDRDLFVYDETADFSINFVFDERQEALNQEQSERQELDVTRDKNNEVLDQVQSLQAQYSALEQTYKANVAAYEADLAVYNADVNTYNDRGGAPPDTFADLEEERQRLSTTANNLSGTAARLNSLVSEINKLGERGNQLVNDYNRDVHQYNSAYGFSREFTQGDYQGDNINIYTFVNTDELVTVLAHEFGHALGIGHVEASSSLMYYLIDEADFVTTLSAEDMQAFLEVCGASETVGQRVRHAIRSLLAKF